MAETQTWRIDTGDRVREVVVTSVHRGLWRCEGGPRETSPIAAVRAYAHFDGCGGMAVAPGELTRAELVARVTELEAALAHAERDAMMVSSLRQSVADAEARTAHEAAKHREWEARWYELVHALIEQQGGSVVVYEMTPNERASHLGRSIVEQPLPASRATRYSLAPADAGGFVASEEIAVGDAVVVKPDGTVAPATPAKKDSDR